MTEDSTPKRRTNVGAKVHPQKRKSWEEKFAGRLDAIDAMWESIRKDVLKAYDDGLPLNEIARMLGVEQSTVSKYRQEALGKRRVSRAKSGARMGQRVGLGGRGGTTAK